jgi:alpha-galactosidase
MSNSDSTDPGDTITLSENGLNMVFGTGPGGVSLLHFSPLPFVDGNIADLETRRAFAMVEVQTVDASRDDYHGAVHKGTSPGRELKYVGHSDTRNDLGRKIEIAQEHDGLEVTSHFQCFDDIPTVRSWTEIRNQSDRDHEIEYVSSFALNGTAKEGGEPWDQKMRLHVPHNSWLGEAQWRAYRLPELGLSKVHEQCLSMKRLSYSVLGTWSSNGLLPMGGLENTESNTAWLWQIEHNGSWQWEVSDLAGHLYLQLSGPTFRESHWTRSLAPGGHFQSVPVSVCAVEGDVSEAVRQMVRYRRRVRRPNPDNETLPVIFNDFMNCLEGDPTEEKLLPLIDAASDLGCEYFVIDAGWYAELDEAWWPTIGLWEPSSSRFPGGLDRVIQAIRSKGMTPGLWLELEGVGAAGPLAAQAPDSWFFARGDTRVVPHQRYQLDFRNPEVVEHANGIISRLVEGYGLGYIKMDYNINAGPGTDRDADSLGDGLLEHNRAYLEWVDALFVRYPDLVIENCGSGGLRMDGAMLQRHSIQSSSDQTDYRKTAAIAVNAVSACTPEQCAVWSYPLTDSDEEETIFNMVNALLLRVHQSGQLWGVDAGRRALIKEALDCYKRIRKDLSHGLPFWPLGFASFESPWTALGMRCPDRAYLAVWRLKSNEKRCTLPIPHLRGKDLKITCAFPEGRACPFVWSAGEGELTVTLDRPWKARFFELNINAGQKAPTDASARLIAQCPRP